MNDTKMDLKLTGLELRIGITITLCLLICKLIGLLGYQVQALAACTGAVMCVQDGGKASFAACKNRLIGVICGGVLGVGVVL